MENFLVFRLYGPMAAWGEIAVGETRRIASYPSKSALLGLVSAALGIRRDEQERLDKLTCSFTFGVKLISAGTLLKDYHTIQVPDSVGKFIFRTRRDELVMGKDPPGTIISTREYRTDSLSVVAVRRVQTASYTLEELKMALMRPTFHLYLGRKSCPPSLPLCPQIISTNGIKHALDSAVFPPIFPDKNNTQDLADRMIKSKTIRYYWEDDAGDMEPEQIFERFDQPLNRKRWQFSPRMENMFIESKPANDKED